MNASEVYLRAAERVASSHGCEAACCTAIGWVCGEQYSDSATCICRRPRVDLAELFRPHGSGTYWFGESFDTAETNHRVISLLFMRQIALDEERRK